MKYVFVPVLARNVLFSENTENYLKSLEERADKPEVKKWIKSNLRTWLINDYEGTLITRAKSKDPAWLKRALSNGDQVFSVSISPEDKEKFNHWVDYLNQYEKPSSIKLISIPQLIRQVKEWEKQFQKTKDDEEDGIKDIHVYPNGFRWVSVYGKNSLNREGKLMKHCVGSYYKKVSENKCEIYSLRDKNNKPHITIEYVPAYKAIAQIKGNSNTPVKEEYLNYLNDFLKKKYVKFENINTFDLRQNGLLFINNRIWSISQLSELFKSGKLVGDINLSYLKNIPKLPDGTIVDGDLNLSRSDISELPDNLTVKGRLDIQGTNVTKLPLNLHIDGDLDLTNLPIGELPNNMVVNGDLNLRNTRIKKIPDSLVVKGELTLAGTSAKLPNNFTVNGNLDLSDSTVTELPDNLTVTGTLSLWRAKNIRRLPENLTVGFLNLTMTEISTLPKSLKITEGLDISDTPITTLPDYIKVKDLVVYNGKLKKLPDNMVLNKLTISRSNITKLPRNLTVKKDLNLWNSNIREIPADLKVRNLNPPMKIKLPDNFTIYGTLGMTCSDNTKLPKGLTVGSLRLSNSKIKNLPNDLVVKTNLNIRDTGIKSIPNGVQVGGKILVSDSNIKCPDYLADKLQVGKNKR